jgi:hypothetical protein
MKDVGITKEGNYLVEMNKTEYFHFVVLCRAVEGRDMPFADGIRQYQFQQEGYDFSETFEVIRAFFEANFQINTLQNLVWGIRSSINRVAADKKGEDG